ncbi:MAG: 3-keto-disaccharide hydrolase [Akkermansiaceae bacterium]
MNNKQYAVLCILVFGAGIAPIESADKANTPKKLYVGPKQPWSEYTVHQEDRPHPPKVETQGAVCGKPPEGAIVLFDGGSVEAFTRAWRVVDGVMIASPGATHTKQAFGDCILHVEWRIPAGRKVSGQQGGNSGIFLMDRYEIQVQESHTNVTYADGQAAAIYGQTPPRVNASVPQGQWQSYDIVFEAPVYGEAGLKKPAYITVIHNGVKVHDRQEVYGPTVYRKIAKYPNSHPLKAPIRFQWHGDPIEFRNVWVKEP